jgi:hypothetical protein
VSPSDVPSLLDTILDLPPYAPPLANTFSHLSPSNLDPFNTPSWSPLLTPPLDLAHWRGRMGLSKAEMIQLWRVSQYNKVAASLSPFILDFYLTKPIFGRIQRLDIQHRNIAILNIYYYTLRSVTHPSLVRSHIARHPINLHW